MTALSLYIVKITQSPKLFGEILALAFVPRFIFSTFSGAIIDRLDKKKVMIALDLIRALILFMVLFTQISINSIIIIILSFAIIDTFFLPAAVSIIPMAFNSEQISKVNSLDQSLRGIFNVLSPLVGSMLLMTCGIKIVILIDMITFLISAISELFITIKQEMYNRRFKFNIIKDMLDIIYKIKSDKRILSLVVNGALTHLFMFTFIEVGMISLIIVVFKRPDIHFGILQGVISAASIISALIAFRQRKRRKISQNINIGICGMIASVSIFIPLIGDNFREFIRGFEYLPLIYLSIACFFMFISFGYYAVFFRSFYQSVIPNQYLGRFSSVFTMLVSLSRIIGMYVYGILFEKSYISLAVILLAGGLILKLIVHIPFLKAEKNQ